MTLTTKQRWIMHAVAIALGIVFVLVWPNAFNYIGLGLIIGYAMRDGETLLENKTARINNE